MEKKVKIRIIDTLGDNECTTHVKFDDADSKSRTALKMVTPVEEAINFFTISKLTNLSIQCGIRSPYDKYSCCASNSEECRERMKKAFATWIHSFSDCLFHIEIEPIDEVPDNFPSTKDVVSKMWEISHGDDDEEWYQDHNARNEPSNWFGNERKSD